MIKFNKKKKGITLLEVLLYMSLVGIIVISIVTFFGTIIENDNRSKAISEVEQSGMQINQYFSYLLKGAKSVSNPEVPGETSDFITFESENATSNPVTISFSSGKILITEGSNEPIELNNNFVSATSLEFKNMDGSANGFPIIKYSFGLTYINPDQRNSLNYSQIFYGSTTARY